MRTLLAASLLSLAAAAPCLGQSLSTRLEGVAAQRQQSAAQTKAGLLGALLYGKVSADFNETPAKDAFEYLKTVLGVPLVVRYDTDRNATSGIDPDAPITLSSACRHRRRVNCGCIRSATYSSRFPTSTTPPTST